MTSRGSRSGRLRTTMSVRGLVLVIAACSSAGTEQTPLAPRVAVDPVVSMNGYSYFWTCALRRSGAVACHSLFALKPPADPVEFDGSCLRTRAGRVFCTNGAEPYREVVGVHDAIRVASSFEASCAIRRDRSVVCWKTSAEAPEAFEVKGLAGASDLAIDGQACAVAHDGRVWCWRGDEAPAPIRDLPGATQIVMLSESSCARLRQGTVACWGRNQYGELGDADPARGAEPHEVPGLDRVQLLVASAESACALRDDGSVWCWGGRAFSQHGERPPARRCRRPTHVVAFHDAVWIWMTIDTLCAVDRAGTRSCLSDSEREATRYGASARSHWLDSCT